MAEALLNQLAGDRFEAESAGIEPGKLNPVVVAAMREIGIDISGNSTKSVQSFLDDEAQFDCVITVCDETSSERCPVFPGQTKRLHWSFPDPSSFTGSFEERLTATARVRDAIRDRIVEWLGGKSQNVAADRLTAGSAVTSDK